MLLDTVSEREREEHMEDRMGREIKKVNGTLGPQCGDGIRARA